MTRLGSTWLLAGLLLVPVGCGDGGGKKNASGEPVDGGFPAQRMDLGTGVRAKVDTEALPPGEPYAYGFVGLDGKVQKGFKHGITFYDPDSGQEVPASVSSDGVYVATGLQPGKTYKVYVAVDKGDSETFDGRYISGAASPFSMTINPGANYGDVALLTDPEKAPTGGGPPPLPGGPGGPPGLPGGPGGPGHPPGLPMPPGEPGGGGGPIGPGALPMPPK